DKPGIYVVSQEETTGGGTQQVSSANPLAATLGAFAKKKKADLPVLCFNADNKLVKRMAEITDPFVFPSIIQILYVQALMLGKYPVNDKEMNLFNEALHNLVITGMENFINI
ncbi:MAG: HSP90 family protein, partial [Pedobacter sp.]|nr:HSP90 family protein [Pedobacter sp.]